jgi:hypothetical protein
MGFESVRGYVHLASGLTEATKARATGAAQGLLSLPAAGISTGSKVAVQAGALAEEMLSVATTNHSSLTALVRSEVDVAIARLGLVPAEKLAEAQAEATRLRTEVARLRAASSLETTRKSTRKRPAPSRRTESGVPATNGESQHASSTSSAKKATTPRSSQRATTTRSANAASTAAATETSIARGSAVSTRVKSVASEPFHGSR